ncbi:addiction module toxin RelE [Pantoea wallisii]|uniref:Addiction module toxin RelE n=1 Tax=Pantoea wallisii TaxID=1076551 RepID=A0A1X1D2R5_9GAMM|nr:type II toxin-antitoxin system RelE/ParE family toxin [Pantoea wallisii]ORM70927.1 addiction module toxin RelE [Pantoea wallisii]
MSVNTRIFKTKWFSKQASRHNITDGELCMAIAAVQQGSAVNLGGGVFKKRLQQNRDRAIVLAKGGRNWIYAFLFAKQDQSDLKECELAGFRALAKHYSLMSNESLNRLIAGKELVEICHDRNA